MIRRVLIEYDDEKMAHLFKVVEEMLEGDDITSEHDEMMGAILYAITGAERALNAIGLDKETIDDGWEWCPFVNETEHV